MLFKLCLMLFKLCHTLTISIGCIKVVAIIPEIPPFMNGSAAFIEGVWRMSFLKPNALLTLWLSILDNLMDAVQNNCLVQMH